MNFKTLISLSLHWLSFGSNFSYCQEKVTAREPTSALHEYVKKPDTSFDFQDYHQIKVADGTFYEVNLISQTWQSITWKHRLIIYFPYNAKYPNTMLVVLRHIYNRNAGVASLKIISDSTGTPAAILYDIPNQPLFDGKEEDDLQAYTFSQYIKTGDATWPLLFPMVKSVVRAMDAVQLLARKEKKSTVNDFVVAGHSKRGHTTWLTAAADKRVKGIIPIAIDILNSSEQLPHHIEAFGAYSTPTKAATDFLEEINQPRGQSLIKMIDAYSYKEQLTQPKLIVLATNDDFFTTDALNLYWDGLSEPKSILYLSNATHVRADADARINPTAFAFVRAIASHKNLPELSWQYQRHENNIALKIKTDTTATIAILWTSESNSKDFRQSVWTPQPMSLIDKSNQSKIKSKSVKEYSIEVMVPATGYMAIFGEVEFRQGDHVFLLSTQTSINAINK